MFVNPYSTISVRPGENLWLLIPISCIYQGKIYGCQSLYPCIYMWPGRNWWLSFLIFLYIYETREILIVVNPCISVWPEENWWLLIHISLYICETREKLMVANPYIPVSLWDKRKIDGCQARYPCISVRPGEILLVAIPYTPVYIWDQEENWWLSIPIFLYICETRGKLMPISKFISKTFLLYKEKENLELCKFWM